MVQWRSQRGHKGSHNSQHFCHKSSRLLFDKVAHTASVLTRSASRPQQWACVHVYADAVLLLQFTDHYFLGKPSPRPVVD